MEGADKQGAREQYRPVGQNVSGLQPISLWGPREDGNEKDNKYQDEFQGSNIRTTATTTINTAQRKP